MISLVFSIFQTLFRFVIALMVAGVFVSVLSDIQKRAFENKRIGLVSLLKVNQQLVGKTEL